MANSLYDYGRELFLSGSLSWTSHDIKVALIDTNDYAVNLSSHQFLSSISGTAIVATSSNLSSKTVTAGVADAEDVILESVTGDQCEAIVIYRDTGVAATSPLIAYIDDSTGLPITPNGADVIISWSNGANKIFKL